MNRFSVSLGVKNEDFQNVSKFLEVGVRNFCIDVAHGDSDLCIQMVNRIKISKDMASPFIIAGHVATG